MSTPVFESLSDLQKKDLRSLPWGYFSDENLLLVYSLAEQKWHARCESTPDKMLAWGETLREFHSSKYWGIPITVNKPTPSVKAPPSDAKKIFLYVWTAFQSLIVLKAIILYFGLTGVDDDRTDYKVYMVLAILFSFGNLFFFAYRNRKDSEEN